MFAILSALFTISAIGTSAISVSITPHAQYSSSVGALGCKLNINRVAYFPSAVNCDDICINITYASSRSLHLLRVDSSAAVYDISYDAWNYLAFGALATDEPQMGGGVVVDYEYVPTDKCKDLLDDGKLSLSAVNSMNYLVSCIGSDSWVATNYELRNILDPVCKYGYDEVCTLDVAQQPHCPHPVGSMQDLGGLAVKNIAYGTGTEESAR